MRSPQDLCRADFSFPLSDEWQAWTAGHGWRFVQSDFAVFLKNRLADIVAPVEQDGVAGNAADPARMAELSHRLAAQAAERAPQVIDVPNLFLIAIPVFEGDTVCRVAVRLRCRLHDGRTVWIYELLSADEVFRRAYHAACAARAETSR